MPRASRTDSGAYPHVRWQEQGILKKTIIFYWNEWITKRKLQIFPHKRLIKKQFQQNSAFHSTANLLFFSSRSLGLLWNVRSPMDARSCQCCWRRNWRSCCWKGISADGGFRRRCWIIPLLLFTIVVVVVVIFLLILPEKSVCGRRSGASSSRQPWSRSSSSSPVNCPKRGFLRRRPVDRDGGCCRGRWCGIVSPRCRTIVACCSVSIVVTRFNEACALFVWSNRPRRSLMIGSGGFGGGGRHGQIDRSRCGKHSLDWKRKPLHS